MIPDHRPYEVGITGTVRASSTSSSSMSGLALFALAMTILVSAGVVLMNAIGSGP